jgi:acetyl-CoA C-acetyltransferase
LEVSWEGLSTITAPRLGAIAIKGALDKINLDPNLVDELMGNVVQAGTGQAPARHICWFAKYCCLYYCK